MVIRLTSRENIERKMKRVSTPYRLHNWLLSLLTEQPNKVENEEEWLPGKKINKRKKNISQRWELVQLNLLRSIDQVSIIFFVICIYHIFWRLRRIPIGAQSNNNDILSLTDAHAHLFDLFFSFLLSVSTRTKCQAINYTPPSTLATLFSLPSLFFFVCVCVPPCVYCCSNGRSWEERSPP